MALILVWAQRQPSHFEEKQKKKKQKRKKKKKWDTQGGRLKNNIQQQLASNKGRGRGEAVGAGRFCFGAAAAAATADDEDLAEVGQQGADFQRI
ncbi:uncharacterized protein PADG_01094 [Paracoccidioides brasiliensis Pb18]|uniref:Uncharacterized protein n=1 Tax=Paracoccidioides brasiliensis (strain Pb18) TaxID=502780 RepID=C1FZ68_PARBD|nr:uncharacterized protein PADG_01094 [Paracoccidioides brasiliensis Pb18]EEH44805.2 hypothetical protein PADG_01094 [Paracoccidioides brasiliensis Pb18]